MRLNFQLFFMIRKILFGLGIVLAIGLCGLLIAASFQESHYKIERSIAIAAPDSVVFPHINRLRNWERWSPWMQNDPTIKNVYAGADAGKTCQMRWTSEESGTGKLVINDSELPKRVSYNLTFEEFNSTSTGNFILTANGNQTQVSWSMEGESTFTEKIFRLLFSLNDAIGSDFERGLNNMKRVIEGH